LIVVVYVDDIIFGGSMKEMCQEFAIEMKKEFEMSMLGELSFFLGLQISQSEKGHIHFTNQVRQGNVEEIQNGRLYTSQHTYGHKL
jgi:hypothetical protein